MSERRLLWRRHSTIESFDSNSHQCSNSNSTVTSPCNSPTLGRFNAYPFVDIFQQNGDGSLYGRPRSRTVGELAFQANTTSPNRTLKAMTSFNKFNRFRSYRGSVDSPTLPGINFAKTNTRRLSVRQSIFNRVAVSPRMLLHRHSLMSVNTLFEDTESNSTSNCTSRSSLACPSNDELVKNAVYYRAMWKKIIVVQIEMLRAQNKSLTQRNITSASEDNEECLTKYKLNYEEIIPSSYDEVRRIWKAILTHPDRYHTRFDRVRIEDAVKAGIPKDMRCEVWRFLVEQHKLDKNKKYNKLKDVPTYRYKSLTKELTSYQHAILIDLGRTFPTHPYFAHPLGPGQMSLFKMLKAYSLLDQEVGYCQGLSFVAGLILLHMNEEKAFDLLVSLMYGFDLRRHYKPDMQAIQIEMYQLSRLLSEKQKDLHQHLEHHEVPSLYAAPWFLTLFASTFPLGFVARVFDFVFLHGGLDVVFKIALTLLSDHKELIKQCSSFESINDFLKLTLPSMSYIQMERIFNQVADIDISRELLGYEVEYQVLQEEMFYPEQQQSNDSEKINKMETANDTLKRQNLELLEKLQQAHTQLSKSEREHEDLETKLESALNTISSYKCKLTNLERRIETLELERQSLLTAVQRMKSRAPFLNNDSEFFLSCDLPSSNEGTNNNRLVRFYSNDINDSDKKREKEKNEKSRKK